MKTVFYHPTSQKDIEAFPPKVRQRIARLLDMLAEGLELQPNDFKYMGTVGAGVYELRIKISKQYRVFYVAKFEEAIYVLHAFVKKTQETSQRDIDKGKERYGLLLRNRK
ncbi:MAG: type II toxin-antitoxin system RelE/ParE family toxin [Gammaproteobacteria bacterium]|nr:type II toxin-antitoxin system RelE/ParE family toxin [Gammaproteobacteria bacterium]